MFERAIDGQETDRVAFRTAKDGGRTAITGRRSGLNGGAGGTL